MRTTATCCSYSTAYLRLRHRITHSYHAPGTRLNITQLADELGMSATPVREALSRLAQEKIIETRQQRGFYVKHVDAAEVTELYALVHMNVGFLLRRMAARGALPTVGDKLDAIFSGSTPGFSARKLQAFQAHLEAEARASNAAASLHILYMRTNFVRLVEFSDPERFAVLRGHGMEMAAMARDDDQSRCYSELDALFVARSAWLGAVIERVQDLAERVSADMLESGELATAV